MSAKHTPGLTRGQVLSIAEKYGEFQFGDAQGDARLAFAADLIEARERIRDAAPEMLEALQDAMRWFSKLDDWSGVGDPDIAKYEAAIAKATGGAA